MKNIFPLDKNDYNQKNDFRGTSQKKTCARGILMVLVQAGKIKVEMFGYLQTIMEVMPLTGIDKIPMEHIQMNILGNYDKRIN
jgi:hypothetical protein